MNLSISNVRIPIASMFASGIGAGSHPKAAKSKAFTGSRPAVSKGKIVTGRKGSKGAKRR